VGVTAGYYPDDSRAGAAGRLLLGLVLLAVTLVVAFAVASLHLIIRGLRGLARRRG
jgi:hypothetical protein